MGEIFGEQVIRTNFGSRTSRERYLGQLRRRRLDNINIDPGYGDLDWIEVSKQKTS
jgi:hypothetical protein